MPPAQPATPLVPPFTVELDDSDPIVVADPTKALGMAAAYLEDAPPNTVATLTDATGRVISMKTDDAGQVIDVPF